jgi:hypothetical protein
MEICKVKERVWRMGKWSAFIEALPLCADLGDDPSEHEIRAWLQKPLQDVKRILRALFTGSKIPPKNEVRETPCLKRPPVLYYEHSPLKGEAPACRIEAVVCAAWS